jgi:hypothetical protein
MEEKQNEQKLYANHFNPDDVFAYVADVNDGTERRFLDLQRRLVGGLFCF